MQWTRGINSGFARDLAVHHNTYQKNAYIHDRPVFLNPELPRSRDPFKIEMGLYPVNFLVTTGL